MSERDRKRLRQIHTFPELVKYLRDDLGWPVEQDSFAALDLDDLTFDWDPEELGIDPRQAAKIEYVKQLQPIVNGEPKGVFFVKFDTNSLPVVALRKLLAALVIRKRATVKAAERPLWAMQDLVFISSYGESEERQLSFAYFQEPEFKEERPALKVLGWDETDTPLHLDAVHDRLHAHLSWPADPKALPAWRKGWSVAFREGHGETVRTAKDLAEELARLARGIRERAKQLLKLETDQGPLRSLMQAFKKALIQDLTDEQFADMYAQTIAYGLLSARITHPDPVKAETLPDLIPVTNPFLKELMETFVLAGGKHRGKKKAHQIDFDELGINDVVSLLRRANMDAVLRNFGADDRREDPVTYFYEDFLNAYDKQERKRRGVYYTPKPVVSYIVRSVHELLQTEFGIEDGLASTITWGEMAKRHKDLKLPEGTSPASPFVQILDPATGTATFLVTVIEVIHETLAEKWKKAGLSEAKRVETWNEYVPRHLLPRLCGYELMMAPYAIAHLKIGLKLFETGYRFGSDERACVYLTNALEPASDASYSQVDALSEALAHEAEAVNAVKRCTRFTAVVGNPPYSNFGQLNKIPFIIELLDDFKRGLNEKKINLDDDFIKFVRLSQHLIQSSGAGVIGMITNHVYLDGITHRVMRHALIETFSHLDFLDLHGSAQKKETAPNGSKEENVFDIKQGVSIAVLSRLPGQRRSIRVGDLFGTRRSKYAALLKGTSLSSDLVAISPTAPSFLFRVENNRRRGEYEAWMSIPQVMPFFNSGLQTKRDKLTLHFGRGELESVLDDFRTRDPEFLRKKYDLGPDGTDWTVALAKADVKRGGKVVRIQYRPFDYRFTYYTGNSKGFLARPRKDVSDCILGGSPALVTMRQLVGVPDECEVFVTRVPMTDRSMASTLGTPYLFPLRTIGREADLLSVSGDVNISEGFLTEIQGCLGSRRSPDPEQVLAYVYAILHAPSYRSRYAEFIRADFPRIPVPHDPSLFRELVSHGQRLIALHLLESPLVNSFKTSYLGPRNPEIVRVGWSDETVWLDAVANKKGQLAKTGTMGFLGIPSEVWNFHVGGYQICERWLKDRKGCRLTSKDIDHYQRIVVAIAETVQTMKELDQLVDKHGGWPSAFRAGRKSE